MQITRNSLDSSAGPAEWFTGVVYLDTIAVPTPPARAAAAAVHFTPGARTAWHTHPFGQTLFVTEGIGRCQREGCAIAFVDTSRNGTRRFCSVRCANQVNVSNHRVRRRTRLAAL